MALNLHPGEQIIFEGHPSWRAILGFYLAGIAIAVAIGFIVKLVEDAALGVIVAAAIIAITVLAGEGGTVRSFEAENDVNKG